MIGPDQRSAILASLLVVFFLFSGGCLGNDAGGLNHTSESIHTTGNGQARTTTIPWSEVLSYRLIIVPVTPSNTTIRVTVTNSSEGNTTVFDENLTLDREHNLSRLFDSTSTYEVRIETNGHVKTYGIAHYEGYKIYVNESGVVRVEAEVL